MKKPARRFTIEIEIGADDWETAALALSELADHVARHGPKYNAVSGGYSSGHVVMIRERPDVTHDSYFAELERFVSEQEKEQPICAEEDGAGPCLRPHGHEGLHDHRRSE